jgi:Thaumarchaeal output domain 1
MSRSNSAARTISFPSRPPACANTLPVRTHHDEHSDSIALLCIPNKSADASMPNGARRVHARGETPDVVVLTEANSIGLIANYLQPSVAAIVPVIDASGEHGRESMWTYGCADLRIKAANSFALTEALLILRPMIDRVRALPQSVLMSPDPKRVLLARLAVRGRDMEPTRDPSFRETIVYPDAIAVPDAWGLAEELVCLGLLERQFFDKLITCPRCDSARLSVRECCSACHSSNLIEEPVIHHLRCSTQAPEQDFRHGTTLICPKCRLYLEHFSVDYDQPGNVMLCRKCGYISTDPAVGFTCLDCQTEGDTDETGTSVVWRYRLTEAGLARVKCDASMPTGVSNSALDRLKAFVSREEAAERPFCVFASRLTQPAGVDRRLWEQTCALFGRLFQEVFTAETEIIDAVVGATPLFLALLAEDCKAEVERAIPDIRMDLERHLSARPRVNYAVFGPDELTRILGGRCQEGSTFC